MNSPQAKSGRSATASVKRSPPSWDVARLRQDFPMLAARQSGRPLVYLDNAATTQKPRAVIETLNRFYSSENANIHRGVYQLSEQATQAYEVARAKVQRFLGAAHSREIVFVRGATEGINLVASSFGRAFVKPGDEILITAMEHHSNIVPWQILCEQSGAILKVVPVNDAGELDMGAFACSLSDRTRLVSVTHVSNSLGTINPVEEIVRLAASRARGAAVLVDGAQAVSHLPVDVQKIGCDFYVFSGHKVFGPTGVGVVYGRERWLEQMPPYQGGGDMIRSVSFEKTTYNDIPYKFEAGTPHIAGVIALGAALDYLQSLDWKALQAHEQALTRRGTELLSALDGLRLIGTARQKVGILSFVLEGVHAHDIGTILDHEAVAIRAGHHCTMPLMQRFGVPATARASLAFYNTLEEVEALAHALKTVREIFHG